MRASLWGIHDPMHTLFPRKVLAPLLVLLVAAAPSAHGASGYQWENISLGLSTTDLSAVAQVPGDTETLLVGGSGLVFRTDDGGDSTDDGGDARGRNDGGDATGLVMLVTPLPDP